MLQVRLHCDSLIVISLEKDVISYIYLSMILIGIMVTVIFTYYNFRKGCFGKLISIQLMLTSYGVGVVFLTANDLAVYFPHTFRTGMLVLYIIPALIYLALSKGILKEPFKSVDLIHLLPLAIYIVNFLPSFTASSEEKINLINDLKTSYFQEGLLFKSTGINLLIIILLLFYMIKIYLKFFYFRKNSIITYHMTTAKIFISYLGIQLMIPALNVLGYFDGFHREMVVAYVITTIAIYITFLLRPNFIYGIVTEDEQIATKSGSGIINKPNNERTDGLPEKGSPSVPFLERHHDTGEEVIPEDLQKIENYLDSSLDFLQVDFTQKMMVQATGLSSYQIRMALRNYRNCTFPTFINNKRIEYLLEKLSNDPQCRLYDSATIANESGFKSVNTFYIAFKKVTGTTPRNYIVQSYEAKITSP